MAINTWISKQGISISVDHVLWIVLKSKWTRAHPFRPNIRKCWKKVRITDFGSKISNRKILPSWKCKGMLLIWNSNKTKNLTKRTKVTFSSESWRKSRELMFLKRKHRSMPHKILMKADNYSKRRRTSWNKNSINSQCSLVTY